MRKKLRMTGSPQPCNVESLRASTEARRFGKGPAKQAKSLFCFGHAVDFSLVKNCWGKEFSVLDS
jgi:hypothetical protein